MLFYIKGTVEPKSLIWQFSVIYKFAIINMNTKTLVILSLLLLPVSTFSLETSSHSVSLAAGENPSCNIKADNGEGEYSETQLQAIAKRITVKVIGDNNGGSGTIIAKRGNTYLVVTNSHVVRDVNKISLKTSDGTTHDAKILPKIKFETSDLALLQFQPKQNYCLLQVPNEIPNTIPKTETVVMAAGYSSAKGEIVFRPGRLQQIPQQSFKEGYQIGYSSDIEPGMSGGAIINSRGELIGINGRSAYPILNIGYVYRDGTRPTEEEIQQMRKLSWGIPITTLLAQVNAQISKDFSLPIPDIQDPLPKIVLTGWLGELEQKAKQFTVRINSSNLKNGSGVIIAKEGDIYTVLTSGHVFSTVEDTTKKCEYCTYQVITHDGKQYPVEKSSIKLGEGVDLGVIKFRSQENYKIATLANYNPKSYQYVFTGGYPKIREKYSSWQFTLGQIFAKETGLQILGTIQSDFENSGVSLTGGYELVYTNITFDGMSGGPILDSQGRVIGIHGRAEVEAALDENSSSERIIKLGNSLGIPISTFLEIAPRLNIQAQKVETTPPPKLNQQKVDSIEEARLSVDVAKEITTASQWLERGNQLWRLRRQDKAIQAFDEAIKQKPKFIHLAYYGKSLALAWNGKYPEAIDAAEQALEHKPDFVPAFYCQILAYRRLKQVEETVEETLGVITKAIKLQPNNPNLYAEKSFALSKLKRYPEAEVAINEAIHLSRRALFYNIRSSLYQKQKKWELALTDYNTVIANNPDNPDGYIRRGNVYSRQKEWELAIANYNTATAKDADNADAYIGRGNVYSRQKEWELAIANYNTAIAKDADNADAYIGRGYVYLDQKKWDLALANYNTAIEKDPDNAYAYIGRGDVYSRQKEWELALANYNTAIAKDADNANAYFGRGNVYLDQKKWELAIVNYNTAIAKDPDFADAYYNRGHLYHQQGNYTDALAEYNQVIAKDSNSLSGIYAIISIGLIKYEQGDKETAIKQWQQAMKIDNKSAESILALAVALYGKGEEKQAYQLAKTALKLDKNFADTNFMKENVWGEKMIADTQKLLSTPQMKAFLSQLR